MINSEILKKCELPANKNELSSYPVQGGVFDSSVSCKLGAHFNDLLSSKNLNTHAISSTYRMNKRGTYFGVVVVDQVSSRSSDICKRRLNHILKEVIDHLM